VQDESGIIKYHEFVLAIFPEFEIDGDLRPLTENTAATGVSVVKQIPPRPGSGGPRPGSGGQRFEGRSQSEACASSGTRGARPFSKGSAQVAQEPPDESDAVMQAAQRSRMQSGVEGAFEPAPAAVASRRAGERTIEQRLASLEVGLQSVSEQQQQLSATMREVVSELRAVNFGRSMAVAGATEVGNLNLQTR
jgi:hypothetical protein